MNFSQQFIVPQGEKVSLESINPNQTLGFKKGKKALQETQETLAEIAQLQYNLYAESKQSLLVILQAMDAAGKDGTINHVFIALNPQGGRVASFKVPTPIEASHDFLWRCHKEAPKHGEIVIFNRSHYEDILVYKVHNLIDKEECNKRFQHINNFEELLADNHTKIVKFFLHINQEEQLERFQQRIYDPAKQWKIALADYQERQYWSSYQQTYEEIFAKCNSKEAPWYIIPANKKWFRNLAVAKIIAETLREMSIELPPPSPDLEQVKKLLKMD